MFHLSLQKDRNIPTLYEKVHDSLGHPVHELTLFSTVRFGSQKLFRGGYVM